MSPIAQRWIAAGAFLAALGVALGAFGAHGLAKSLAGWGYAGDDLARRMANYETAVRYQMFHALGLVLVGLALAGNAPGVWRWSAWVMLLGVLLFSGLLYVLALAGPAWRWLGAVVPVGGLSLIVAWLLLAIGALKK
jgi:uncharacterized membrane protein YgdD (TMEM256/DUF423 family)